VILVSRRRSARKEKKRVEINLYLDLRNYIVIDARNTDALARAHTVKPTEHDVDARWSKLMRIKLPG